MGFVGLTYMLSQQTSKLHTDYLYDYHYSTSLFCNTQHFKCVCIFYRSNKIFVVGRFKDQVPLGQAAISQESSVLESGDPSKILRHLSSGDLFTDADGTTANGTAANGTEEPHSLTKQRHISPVGSFDVLDVENLYETGNVL